MRKELSNFQELIRLVKARLARASTVDEVEVIQHQVRSLRAKFVREGVDDTQAGDQAKEATCLCAARLNELREKELADLFK